MQHAVEYPFMASPQLQESCEDPDNDSGAGVADYFCQVRFL